MCRDAGGPCRLVEDAGFVVCMYCGCVKSRSNLTTKNTSFGTVTSRMRPAYTRSGRFTKKILGALNRRISAQVDELCVKHLKERKIKTPEDVLEGIRTWVTTSARKPYVNAAYYGRILGLKDVVMSPRDEVVIRLIFDEVFFAHKRLGFKGPNFPFSELLHLIVESFEFDESTKYVVRYAKRLRCPIRTARYEIMFRYCMAYIIRAKKLDFTTLKCRLTSSSSDKTNHN